MNGVVVLGFVFAISMLLTAAFLLADLDLTKRERADARWAREHQAPRSVPSGRRR